MWGGVSRGNSIIISVLSHILRGAFMVRVSSSTQYRPRLGLYKILFHFEALLHNNIFSKHPLYCTIYCTILPVIAPPAQF